MKKLVAILFALALILLTVLAIPVFASTNEVEAAPIPEFSAATALALLSALAAAVYLLRRRRIANASDRMRIFETILCIVLIVLLVPFAVTNTATGSTTTTPSSSSLAVVSVMTMALAGFTSLWILLTGKKKGPSRFQSHLSLTAITGRVLSFNGFGTNLVSLMASTSRFGSFVGCVYTLFGSAYVF